MNDVPEAPRTATCVRCGQPSRGLPCLVRPSDIYVHPECDNNEWERS